MNEIEEDLSSALSSPDKQRKTKATNDEEIRKIEKVTETSSDEHRKVISCDHESKQ